MLKPPRVAALEAGCVCAHTEDAAARRAQARVVRLALAFILDLRARGPEAVERAEEVDEEEKEEPRMSRRRWWWKGEKEEEKERAKGVFEIRGERESEERENRKASSEIRSPRLHRLR